MPFIIVVIRHQLCSCSQEYVYHRQQELYWIENVVILKIMISVTKHIHWNNISPQYNIMKSMDAFYKTRISIEMRKLLYFLYGNIPLWSQFSWIRNHPSIILISNLSSFLPCQINHQNVFISIYLFINRSLQFCESKFDHELNI